MYKSLMFDEEKLASDIYNNGFTTGQFDFGEAVLVAKYFRHSLGYGDARTKTFIREFCSKNDKFFRKDGNRRTIKGILSRSKPFYVNKSNPLLVYQEEIDVINSISDYKRKRILFAILALSKLNKDFFIGNFEWKNIRRVLHSKITNKNISSFMSEYYMLNLIELRKLSHRVLFGRNSGNALYEITSKTIYNLNKVFEDIFGKDLFECIDCHTEHEKKSYNQKRCSNCSKINRRERKRVEERKRRESRGHTGVRVVNG